MSFSGLNSLAQEQLHHPFSPICPAIGPPSFPSCTGSSVQIDCRLEDSLTEMCTHRETRKWSADAGRCLMSIDRLPDVALLEIFECYMDQVRENLDDGLTAHAWSNLVHVCQKWRTVVFGSPRRLDLQLFCTETTPVKETLAVWPPLPIIIDCPDPRARMDNIIVALEHSDRICKIDLDIPYSQWEKVFAAMQQPFPALTDFMNEWFEDGPLENENTPVVPESFLGGSAPRLQHLSLTRVPFPGLPKLLLSATGLVSLHIWKIPHSGYISPDAMVRCLSTLTRLERLVMGFESPLSRPVRETRHPRPSARLALPALASFHFVGVSEYLDDIVAWIDAPVLGSLHIWFFHQLIFDTPQLTRFLARTPNIQPPIEAYIVFYDYYVEVTSARTFPRTLVLGIKCRKSDWQLSSLTQLCSSSFPDAFISMVEHLYVIDQQALWQNDIEDSQWLEVLHPFTAVKYLHLSQKFVSRIVPAMQELAGEVLPSLQNLFLEDLHPSGPFQGAIGKFVSARQLAGHPIAVSSWDGN